MTKIPNHSMILVKEKGEDWSLVSYKTKTGYVKNSLITIYDPLPFESVKPGDKNGDILELKKRLKSLGYAARSIKLNQTYDKDLLQAIQRFQEYNGLDVTDVIVPELYAYILWNDLPPYGATASSDPLSGLTCKLSYSISNYKQKSNGNVTMSVKYTPRVSGGTEPYKIKVKLLEYGISESDAPVLQSNPHTLEWYQGSTADTFKLLLVVTDAEGVTVSAVAHGVMDIPYEWLSGGSSNADEDDDEHIGEY